MVSFHTPLSPRKVIQEFEDSSKKRKWPQEEPHEFPDKPFKARNIKSLFDTPLHQLDTPLPLEWQRCLDIQSGQLYYFNTKTNMKTTRDPRISPDPPSPKHMSLDLELNLPCGPSAGNNNHNHHVADNFTKHVNSGHRRSPSWLACDQSDDQQEMVTAVCSKCHMLVMMFKSSPACPNCKFIHPLDQTPTCQFNNRGALGLFC